MAEGCRLHLGRCTSHQQSQTLCCCRQVTTQRPWQVLPCLLPTVCSLLTFRLPSVKDTSLCCKRPQPCMHLPGLMLVIKRCHLPFLQSVCSVIDICTATLLGGQNLCIVQESESSLESSELSLYGCSTSFRHIMADMQRWEHLQSRHV